MANSTRATHLVGSVPADNAEAAMTMAHEHLGASLRWLPDGETGERFHWVINVVEGMRNHPDLEIAKDGDWSDYDKTPAFKVRKGHKLAAERFDFGYVRAFEESLPAYRRARAAANGAAPTFQVGIPSDLDMALFVFGPKAMLRRRPLFRAVTLEAIRRIHALGGSDVVFQIEVPIELVSVARAPRPLQPLAARIMGRGIAKLAAGSPAGARFGVHLCLGDMNHKALVAMKDMGPVVALANAIVKAWPAGRTLEFMHAPFAGASQAPPTDPAYYAPLAGLELPAGTRMIAGFAYEHQSLEEQKRVLEIIERAYGKPVDISAACGLGRRSPEEAVASMDRARQLAEA